MRKFYKPLSVLLALSMCVSMIAPAFAADEKVKPDHDIQDHLDYQPTAVEGVLDELDPENKTLPEEDDSISAVIDVIVDKVDQEAVDKTNEAAKELTETAAEDEQKATEAADKANELADALEQIVDAVTEVPKEVDAEAATKDETVKDKDGNAVTNEGKEVEVLDVQIKDNGDGTQVPTVEVKVEVTKDEEGKPKTEKKDIDQFASEKATAVETAKRDAETAATGAQNALEAAQTAVTNRDQAALDTAKNAAAQAFADANEAAKTAAETYAVAEKVVTDAQAAYDAAVKKLTDAGYNLEDIKGQLEAAQKAVADAQEALNQAAGAKAEAEKQRDYALLYNSLAQTITSKYTYTEEDLKGTTGPDDIALPEGSYEMFADALTQLNEVAKKYGTMEGNQLAILAEVIGGSAGEAFDAREKYLDWLNSDKGKELMEQYDKAKAALEAWEKDKDGHLTYKPEYKDGTQSSVPLVDGDLLYILYFYTFQNGVKGSPTGLTDGTYGKYTNEVQKGLKQYLDAEDFLNKVGTGDTETTFKAGNSTITSSKDKITVETDNGKQVYTREECEKMGISWDTVTAMVSSRIRSEMAAQLGKAYKDVFVDKNVKQTWPLEDKTYYDMLQGLVNLNPGGHKELDSFMKYLDMLQYELQFREKNMAYGAAWDGYKDVVDSTDVVNVLLSGYNLGISELKKELEAELADPNKTEADKKQIQEILDSFSFGEDGKPNAPSETMIKYLLAGKGILEDLKADVDPEISSIYNVVVEHAKAKLKEAQEAATAADNAVKAYEAAKTAAENAKNRLDELLKTTNLSAIEGAKQKLADAQAELTAAEANRDAALAKQQQAAGDYATAMALVIASGGGSGTGDAGTGGTGDGGDSGTTILDQAVPLAGLVTRAEFLNYLYERMGKPETALSTFTDVPEDHEYAMAIGWGQASGLVAGYGDGTFRPDELVIVADVRVILGNYARVFGTNVVAAADLKTLTGENDEIVMNSGEVLAEFFGEEYVPAEEEDAETVA